MELRQLRYFVTVAEELHFGRAALREHIVQSALGQHIRRLERELGVPLFERNTHRVRLSEAGEAMIGEVRSILASLQRAVALAQRAGAHAAALRVSIVDASLGTMPRVLHQLHAADPGLVVDRVEMPVAEQFDSLLTGVLDVGLGDARSAPPGIASELLRWDRLGVLVAVNDPFAGAESVRSEALAERAVVAIDDSRGAGFNGFVSEAYASDFFGLLLHPGQVQSILAAAHLVANGNCVAIVPQSCNVLSSQVTWLPLVPEIRYPWSLLWRDGNATGPLQSIRDCARTVQKRLGWLQEFVPSHPNASLQQPLTPAE